MRCNALFWCKILNELNKLRNAIIIISEELKEAKEE